MKTYWIALSTCALLLGCRAGSPVPPARGAGTSDTAGKSPQASDPPRNIARLTYAQRRGKRLFTHYCAICHGEGGAGDGFNAFNLAPAHPRDLTVPAYMAILTDSWIREVIREGGRGTRKSVLMPAWGHTLTEGQIEDLVAFIRTLSRQRKER